MNLKLDKAKREENREASLAVKAEFEAKGDHSELLDNFLSALDDIDALEAENKRLKELLAVSEDYRKAYQDGKYKLYAMGGDICEAAAEHLPMGEGPLERACRKALKA